MKQNLKAKNKEMIWIYSGRRTMHFTEEMFCFLFVGN